MSAPTTASRLRMPGVNVILARFESAMKEYVGFNGTSSNRTLQEILA
eukprot:CAMPEP_0174868154 /NCGR_PEP_ID=MMETSP1114-20130205/65444_1 /TAXON_ID=312471 /ORGANISM="Neobodo designis, Strain CCAP 1951/1" /LENGTH=46 /DNA_ID= /DNA_START= /DNA_END= /DNA_ORIENTATION=